MEILCSCCLALLEMTFVFVVLLLLLGLRKVIGSAGFYLSFGLLFVFAQLLGAAGLTIVTGYTGLNFNLASTVLFLPILTALMVIYIVDGTLEAQRLIIGLMASLGLYVYLCSLTAAQLNWNFVIGTGVESEELSHLVRGSIGNMSASILAFSVDMFLIPIIFQKLRNFGCRGFFCVAGALFVGQALDSILYSSICYWGESRWWSELTFSYLSRACFALWLSVLASIYLARIGLERPGAGRGSLDIIIAFFGTYGRAKALEHDLRETEERYRLLFRSAADMIGILDRNGRISDANAAAFRMLGLETPNPVGLYLQDLSDITPKVWANLPKAAPSDGGSCEVRCSAKLIRTGIEAELSFSPVTIFDLPMLIVYGRDVTAKRKLDQEREEWQTQTFHRQRLESIGRLAGGIAHDFNNYLHAVQGHLDIIRYMHPVEDKDVNRHLDQIDKISDKASLLTKQLLGFARKGNYTEVLFPLSAFLRSTIDLFLPNSSLSAFSLQVNIPRDRDYVVSGDQIQLQQSILNILFNARDAMAENPENTRLLTVSLGAAEEFHLTLRPPPEAIVDKRRQYVCIRIADSGPGIDPAIAGRIFEPFFTTKPVGKGTGMGLSMAYGILLAHKGWIQVENASRSGAVFALFLPLSESDGDDPMESTRIFDARELSGK